jgi:hypothetical protein
MHGENEGRKQGTMNDVKRRRKEERRLHERRRSKNETKEGRMINRGKKKSKLETLKRKRR